MSVLVNRVRKSSYMDSVALMRISRSVSALGGVESAALMIGSATNRKLMREAGLLDTDGEGAGQNDLVLAIRAWDSAAASAALQKAEALLDKPDMEGPDTGEWCPKSLATALQQLPGANLVLISVPGEFAAAEARRALNSGLHVMMFSDNVPLADEIALKQEARVRGLLMMGPDCGTAIIAGTPLAFANVVPRGNVGIVAASGTGLQEVSSLLARQGRGISHAIGVGGRDLKEEVGGIMTLMAIEALNGDANTAEIVLISKPPAAPVARKVLDVVARCNKHFSICFLGADALPVPSNAVLCSDLRSAVESVLGGKHLGADSQLPPAGTLARRVERGRTRVQGLFSGGTMCAEAQVFFRRAGLPVSSNVPISGVAKLTPQSAGHTLIDLGDDEYTVGRPHPMIDPSLRNDLILRALADGTTGIVLLDVVIGYGANPDPAGELAKQLPEIGNRKALVIGSVCGTEGDPQSYSRQAQALSEAGVLVAPSNAHAAELAIEVSRRLS